MTCNYVICSLFFCSFSITLQLHASVYSVRVSVLVYAAFGTVSWMHKDDFSHSSFGFGVGLSCCELLAFVAVVEKSLANSV